MEFYSKTQFRYIRWFDSNSIQTQFKINSYLIKTLIRIWYNLHLNSIQSWFDFDSILIRIRFNFRNSIQSWNESNSNSISQFKFKLIYLLGIPFKIRCSTCTFGRAAWYKIRRTWIPTPTIIPYSKAQNKQVKKVANAGIRSISEKKYNITDNQL